ncbi:MAG: RNA methyltransferase [Oscillospiraceae bacterium]|nr:RNA methyltransferase [Oscillospiraceae bacterium]
MPQIIEITDFESPELDVFARLTEVQLRNRKDPQKGIFIAESAEVIRLALEEGYEPLSVLIEKKRLYGPEQKIIERIGDIPVYTADEILLTKLTGYKLVRGMLCAMRRPVLPCVEEICKNARRIAVLENIADSTNVGAIIRSAAALNIDAVLVTPSCCDPLCRRAVRVSMGTVFQIPWTHIGDDASGWPHEGIERLRNLGFKTAAMALSDDSVSIDDPDLMAEDRLAVIFGTEGTGLCQETIAECDYTVRIPMYHNVDSLNVAASSAVAFWQLRVK